MKKNYKRWQLVYVLVTSQKNITIYEWRVVETNTVVEWQIALLINQRSKTHTTQLFNEKDVYTRRRDAMRSLARRVRFVELAYKTFDDLKHGKHPNWFWTQATEDFDNWYGVSVIKSEYSYGGDKWLYELAVLKSGKLCYTTHITEDVLWYLTKKDVTKYMMQVQDLPKE